MRDRLIELIKDIAEDMVAKCGDECDKCSHGNCVGKLADHLLSEGVIVLPCKVGQWVYVPWRWEGQQAVAMVKVEEIKFYDSYIHYMFLIDMESDDECFNQSFGGWKIAESIGKTVFLTREEAEKALERSENGK